MDTMKNKDKSVFGLDNKIVPVVDCTMDAVIRVGGSVFYAFFEIGAIYTRSQDKRNRNVTLQNLPDCFDSTDVKNNLIEVSKRYLNLKNKKEIEIQQPLYKSEVEFYNNATDDYTPAKIILYIYG